MDHSQKSKAEQVKITIRAIRVMGAVLLLAGLAVFFDAGGIAAMIGVTSEDDTARIVGGALMFVGLFDLVFVPRLLEKAASR